MRKLIAAGCMLFFPFLTSWARAEPAKEITMLTWGGAFMDAFKGAATSFQKETGIKVDFVTQVGAAGGLNKIMAQKDAPQVDVWSSIESTAETAAKAGLLYPLDPAKIPNLKKLPKDFVKPDSVSIWLSPRGIFYRSDLVPFKITKWQDLWDKRLKGSVGVSFNLDTASFLIMSALINGGSESDIGHGFKKIEALKPNIATVYHTDVESIRLLETGEIAVAGWGGFSNVYKHLGPDSKYRFVMPPSPQFLPSIPVAIVRGRSAGQTEAAEMFVDYLLSPEVQTKMVSIVGTIPANPAAERPEAARRYLPEKITPYQIKWSTVMDNYQSWSDRWDRELR